MNTKLNNAIENNEKVYPQYKFENKKALLKSRIMLL